MNDRSHLLTSQEKKIITDRVVVMFSQVCVIYSVHREAVEYLHAPGRGCLPGFFLSFENGLVLLGQWQIFVAHKVLCIKSNLTLYSNRN